MIDLSSILSYLPSDKIEDLEKITQRIIDLGGGEIVILFGSYARGDYKEQRGKNRGKKSDYDIFVVTSNSENRNKLRLGLREIFKDIGVSVQLIVEQISFVNNHLEEMQYFFTDIKREGKVLFDSGKYELSNSKELTPIRRREVAEEDFEMWFGTAQKIMDSIRVDYKLAAFDLQQVAEMCYTAIEMVFTHYNPYEHNLEVLRNRVLLFDSRVNDTLPCETEEQQELFDYLNFAYIGGRYRSEKEFPVTKEQLNYWHKEVKELFIMTEIICKERIEGLKKIEHE